MLSLLIINLYLQFKNLQILERVFFITFSLHVYTYFSYNTLKFWNFTFIVFKVPLVKVGKTDSLRETIITSGLPRRERKEGGCRRVVTLAGLSPTASPRLPPRLVPQSWHQWKKAAQGMNPRGYTATMITEGSRVELRRNSPRSESLQRAARIAPINYRR